MQKKSFQLSIISLILWTILMSVVIPANGSILKMIISLLLWISFTFVFRSFALNYNHLIKEIPKQIIPIYFLLIAWNLFNIIRSVFEGGNMLTMFGNQYTSLSLLIPFVMIFGIYVKNLRSMRNILFSLLKLAALFLPILAFPIITINKEVVNLYSVLLFGSVFFISTLLYENNLNKLYIILGAFILIVFILPETRTVLLRDLLLLFSAFSIFIYQKTHKKVILNLAFLMILIPFYFLYEGVILKKSIFQEISTKSDVNISLDTRTFLYEEVIHDLIKSNSLLIGKGANSTYFSEYFTYNEGDTNKRLTVEVGFLSILLKGGIIAVILNFSIFFYAIYLAFFRSNNYYAIALGYFLLIHVILMFIENVTAYSLYNYIVWLCIGFCLNNKFRLLNNKQIKVLIKGKSPHKELNNFIVQTK